MGKKRDLTTEQRTQIQVLIQEGLSQRAVATRLSICQSNVSAGIKRMKETPSYKGRPRAGHPRVTSTGTDCLIRRAASAIPTTSSSAIQSSLAALPVVPSCRTIRRRLLTCGLKSYKAARKPRLSKMNIVDRLGFARRYAHWTAEDWKNVMFSDESTVSQFQYAALTIRRPPNSRYRTKYVLPTVKHPVSVMIWGGITARGRAGLWFLPPKTHVNAKIYLDILKEKLPFWMQQSSATIFQQDGAPCHTARCVKNGSPARNLICWKGGQGHHPTLTP